MIEKVLKSKENERIELQKMIQQVNYAPVPQSPGGSKKKVNTRSGSTVVKRGTESIVLGGPDRP